MTLLGAIAGLPLLGIGAGVGVYVGGLDVVPLLAAIAGCHCWAAIAGDRGWAYKLVTLLGAIAECHCWAAIAGCHCWRHC